MTERYNFGGFTFSGTEQNYYVLQIQINNFSKIGTSYTTKIEIELTDEERLVLMKNLMTKNIQVKDID